MKKAKLTLMCGLARCGKSTWIRNNKKNAIVICPDDIRANIFGNQFFVPAESFVWGIALSMARILLEQGKDVLVDATNITFGSRDKFISIAKELDCKVRVVWIKTSIKVCLNRNAKSDADNKLPDGIIEGMAKTFQDPHYKEGVELIQIPKKSHSTSVGTWDMPYYYKELKKMGLIE